MSMVELWSVGRRERDIDEVFKPRPVSSGRCSQQGRHVRIIRSKSVISKARTVGSSHISTKNRIVARISCSVRLRVHRLLLGDVHLLSDPICSFLVESVDRLWNRAGTATAGQNFSAIFRRCSRKIVTGRRSSALFNHVSVKRIVPSISSAHSFSGH